MRGEKFVLIYCTGVIVLLVVMMMVSEYTLQKNVNGNYYRQPPIWNELIYELEEKKIQKNGTIKES